MTVSQKFSNRFFFLYVIFSGLTVLLLTICVLKLSSSITSVRPPASLPDTVRCQGPIVYNKPHKTGSTTIRVAMLEWAVSQNRRPIKCSPYITHVSSTLRECIPHDPSGCAVVATHIELDPGTREMLRERLGGKFITVTSTRDPSKRLVSYFLQLHQTNQRKAKDMMPQITKFFDDFNPWRLYNYHSGEARNGTCPLMEVEKRLLDNLVKHYDIVIDVDLRKESNAILKKARLFQLPDKVINYRGASLLTLDEGAKRALKKASCVEEEMHRLFRLRMASLYTRASGKPCLTKERYPKACFEQQPATEFEEKPVE